MQKIFLLSVMAALFLIYSCSKNYGGNTAAPPEMNCSGIDSHFAAVVLPIIQANCATAGCHASGSSNGPGALTNFLQISSASVNIKNAVLSGRMPKGSSLNAQVKNTIICWVNSGAPNN
jgi:hypothetical protein